MSLSISDVDVRFSAENFARYGQLPLDQYPLTFEGCQRRKDGTILPVEVRLAALETEQGRLMLALARDITDRKRAEEELHQEQRRLREMLELHDRDRKLVAYEIHDGVAQQLTGATYHFEAVSRLLDDDPAAAREMFDSAMQLLHEAISETRRLIGGLRPPKLDEAGVVAAVDTLIAEQRQQEGPEIEFIHDPQFDRLPTPLESGVFRIVQECLTNARRHSKSEKVRLELARVDDHIHIDIRDWGVGFDPAAVPNDRFGLQGIRERARLLGGAATIQSAPRQGAHVVVDLPVTLPEDDTAHDPSRN